MIKTSTMSDTTSSSRRRDLKALAHELDPLIQIGKQGVTDGVVKNIDAALRNHELIKIKFLEHKEEKEELTRRVAEQTRSEKVDIIGNTAILYRQNLDPKKRKVKLKRRLKKIPST